ncbi:nucleotidyltransferase family protein [Sulfitobacter sp. F26204]|uniref:nucleotidyltransferase family protein n=1 Tax=Sulfitobacter sp. F26204 TaxID=2996014 RepID=UPI00225E12DF|nr:nucleotidyltransferase family protein [Sulfitobacter sp. F26204]MCX7558230.1 nucleotidyltransferase family protein [Sulfitobacter sp. F26204]
MSTLTSPVMMFAAGFGTRMKHLTQDQPKPLIPVAGKPLIGHALDLARAGGGDPIVANLHYKADMLDAYLKPLGVQTITERPDILETGGGLRNALPLIGPGPVITMNTDAIWVGPNPIELLRAVWDPDVMDALLVCVPTASALGYEGTGDFLVSETGRMERGSGAVFGGIQMMKTDLLQTIPDSKFSLNLVWNKMLQTGRLFGLTYPGKWCDVGHPGGISIAENMLERNGV